MATVVLSVDQREKFNKYFCNQEQRNVAMSIFASIKYWQDKENGCPAGEAIMFMCMKYGGVARKQAIIEFNGIYNNTLNALNDMVCDRIEKKWVNSITPNDTPLKYL